MNDKYTKLTDSEIVKCDKASIYLGNIFTVDFDLSLPTAGKLGSTITWESKNKKIISNDGKVTRPEAGQGNIIVTIVATITKGEALTTGKYQITVIEKEEAPIITAVKEISIETYLNNLPKLPTVHKLLTNPFDLNQVILQDRLFISNRDRTYEYLLSINEEQMLYNFRDAALLDTKNVSPMSGWDSPDCNLRGHTIGHYLSALAQAYASSGEDKFKTKLDYIITELQKCQDSMAASGKFSPGFLSGYSEDQFIKLEELTTYPKIWAPYYTLHKIMAGLLDCYTLASNTKAIDICLKLGDWVYARLSRLSKEKLNNMWSLYIAGEFGGMNEVMAKLYSLTGCNDYITAAKFYNNDKLYIPMANNYDTLGDMHANQHIPQIIGALQIFNETKEPYYYDVANNFWSMIIDSHIYNIGGTGSGEMFKPKNKIARYITDKTAETCATYNMLKLSRGLFCYNPEAKYMDYYERALYNHILASQDQSAPNGGSTYFMPLCPGMQKEFDTDENSCCHGTSMENHTKYQDSIYFKSEDMSTLYVNLYIASILNWSEKGFTIIQAGDYLIDQAMSIVVNGIGKLNLKLRIPFWIEKGFSIKINGENQNIKVIPGSYITLSRKWSYGDSIDISMPFSFRLERTPDDFNTASIMYGPLVMVAKSNLNKYIELTLETKDISKSIEPTENALTFTTNGFTLVPNYAAYNFPYHAYFKIK